MFHKHIKRIIRYIRWGIKSTFILANNWVSSPCQNTYYFLDRNCCLIKFGLYRHLELINCSVSTQNFFEYVLEFNCEQNSYLKRILPRFLRHALIVDIIGLKIFNHNCKLTRLLFVYIYNVMFNKKNLFMSYQFHVLIPYLRNL